MFDERVDRGKWLIGNAKHAAMATVNADGTPHNTPYLFMKSDDLSELYWSSHASSLHSHNVARTGEVFIVLYDANDGGGLYIKCSNARPALGKGFDRALSAHNALRLKYGKSPLLPDHYAEALAQHMYIADTVTFWINCAERDSDGRILEDKRVEVARFRLLPG